MIEYVPKVSMTQYVCFGLEFSEKSWIYLLAVQMFFGEGLSSVIAGTNGLLVGILYDRNFFGIQKLRLPVLLEVKLQHQFMVLLPLVTFHLFREDLVYLVIA
jgi:hypothetical protein